MLRVAYSKNSDTVFVDSKDTLPSGGCLHFPPIITNRLLHVPVLEAVGNLEKAYDMQARIWQPNHQPLLPTGCCGQSKTSILACYQAKVHV